MTSTEEFLRNLIAEEKAEVTERYERLRREGLAAGKEPFDLDVLELHYRPLRYLKNRPPREERLAHYRHVYYADCPKIMTIVEFARQLEVADRYR